MHLSVLFFGIWIVRGDNILVSVDTVEHVPAADCLHPASCRLLLLSSPSSAMHCRCRYQLCHCHPQAGA
jgi:hypothetical protein